MHCVNNVIYINILEQLEENEYYRQQRTNNSNNQIKV